MNEELIAKLGNAKTADEILAIAKEYGKELTAGQAEELLARVKDAAGELSDEDLNAVAGGMSIWHYN